MGMFDDERRLKMLASEAVEYGKTSRRSMLAGMGGVVGAALAGFPQVANAEDVKPSAGGKKVRVGVPLTYGPFNQPWRRGCWQL